MPDQGSVADRRSALLERDSGGRGSTRVSMRGWVAKLSEDKTRGKKLMD